MTMADDRPWQAHKLSRETWHERAEARAQRQAAQEALMLELVRAAYGATLTVVAAMHGLDVRAVRAQLMLPGERPADRQWLAASRCRDLTLYLVNTGLSVPQHSLARVADLDPKAVTFALRRVEDRRDDPLVDQLIELAEQVLKGEA